MQKSGVDSASQDVTSGLVASGSNQTKQSPYLKQLMKAREYRRLKQDWPNNVQLGRSLIQGLGLFAKHDMEKVRASLTYVFDPRYRCSLCCDEN